MKTTILKSVMMVLVALFSLNTNAYDAYIDGIYYNLVEKAKIAEVTCKSSDKSENEMAYSTNRVVIPKSIEHNGVTYSVTKIGDKAFYYCSQLTSVIIPDCATSIGDEAFSCCNRLSSIIIPNSVTSIGAMAFYNCQALNSVTISNSVTTIGRYAFDGCSSLVSLTIPNSVTSIGRAAFQRCTSLKYVNIPESVKEIDSYTFNNCIGLTSVNIPESVTKIGGFAFCGCSELSSLNFPQSVIFIGQEAFRNCSNLTSITIPNGLTSIGSKVFMGCERLASISIPASITSVKEMAFSNCKNLTDVYCYTQYAPSIESNVFIDSFIEYTTLHVPEASIEQYKADAVWGQFGTIVAIVPPTHTLTYMVDGEEYKSFEIKEGATIMAEEEPTKEGYTFSGWNEIPATMPTHDVIVTGTFNINKYWLTYTVDGEEYKSYEVEYGATITSEAEPTKEGYTFSGWSYIPKKMPAEDVTVKGTFTTNNYTLTYMVDGAVYKKVEMTCGSPITPEAEPIKEGHTFSGWNWIPETMPAKDVTVTGSFTINKYKLVYKVDDEAYKTFEVEYGAEITPEAEPTKEGYTFSGWSLIPEKMPAKDVTITGSFTRGQYKLTYMLDGETYKTISIDFGIAITAEASPIKEGYTFSGWSEIPATMPAKDVTVTGSFVINKYKLIYQVDGEDYKTYEVEYGANLTPEVEPSKDSYSFSGWSEIPSTMPAEDVTITGYFTFIDAIEDVVAEDDTYEIYTLDGKQVEALQKGVNIIRYSNGSTQKVFVK